MQVALGVACLLLLYTAFEPLVWARPIPEVRVPPAASLEEEDLSFDRFTVIGKRNLFGTLEFAPLPIEEDEEEEIAESQLRVKLLGTVVTDPPVYSSAMVENETTREHLVVRVEDLVAGARVTRIERGRIVVENRGELEAIVLDTESDRGESAATARAATAAERRRARIAARRTRARQPQPQGSTSLTERVRELGRRAREAQEQQPPRPADPILGQARMLPSYAEDGRLEGLKVSSIRAGSALETAGLEDGDIIQAVNGTEISSPTQGLRMLRNLGKDDRFNIEVDRGGEPVNLEYTPEGP